MELDGLVHIHGVQEDKTIYLSNILHSSCYNEYEINNFTIINTIRSGGHLNDFYRIIINFYDKLNNLLNAFDTGNLVINTTSNKWFHINTKRSLSNVSYITIEERGKDDEFWNGFYGSQFLSPIIIMDPFMTPMPTRSPVTRNPTTYTNDPTRRPTNSPSDITIVPSITPTMKTMAPTSERAGANENSDDDNTVVIVVIIICGIVLFIGLVVFYWCRNKKKDEKKENDMIQLGGNSSGQAFNSEPDGFDVTNGTVPQTDEAQHVVVASADDTTDAFHD